MPSDIELRPFDPPRQTKQGIPVLDEVIATGCDVHLEQMTDRQFSLVLGKGSEERRFWLDIRGGKLELTSDE